MRFSGCAMVMVSVLAILPGPSLAGADLALQPVPGGVFTIGDPAGDANEVSVRVTVAPFSIMQHEVTNDQFAVFVERTGYLTDVEKSGAGYVWTDRWRSENGVNWRQPHNRGSDTGGLGRHPVIQVSARDAEAFCAHHQLRLPTENEWEFAARGTDGRRYPWGDSAPVQNGADRRANFGTVSCCSADASDGFSKTSPVGTYRSGVSPFGLFDMAGNVWEWTSSPFPGRPGHRSIRGGGWGNNPHCLRTAYRHGNPPDIGLDMVGFRCAGDP